MKTKEEIEKNIWVPISVLLGIQFQKFADAETVRWSSMFLLFVVIFWCWRWLRLFRKNKG